MEKIKYLHILIIKFIVNEYRLLHEMIKKRRNKSKNIKK